MRKRIAALSLAASGAAVALMPLIAKAELGASLDGTTVSTGTTSNIGQLVNTILQAVMGVVGVILIVMLVIGGVQYLTGAGNEEQVGKAKKLMLNAVIGLIITVAAYAIGTFVINALQ